jgi:hypothetical protein
MRTKTARSQNISTNVEGEFEKSDYFQNSQDPTMEENLQEKGVRNKFKKELPTQFLPHFFIHSQLP